MAEKEIQTTSKKVSSFLDANKKIFVTILAVVVVAVVGIICYEVVSDSQISKNLSEIDAITYALTNGSADSEDVNAKRDEAAQKLVPFTKKGGIVGVRANMVCAELAYQKEDYAASCDYWNAVAEKSKKSYTAPLAYYNAGVCCEKLNKIEDAAENYKKAASDKDFILSAHAKFSYGRVLETLGKYEEAATAYSEVNDISPDDKWANLAKTRIIAMKAEGKIE